MPRAVPRLAAAPWAMTLCAKAPPRYAPLGPRQRRPSWLRSRDLDAGVGCTPIWESLSRNLPAPRTGLRRLLLSFITNVSPAACASAVRSCLPRKQCLFQHPEPYVQVPGAAPAGSCRLSRCGPLSIHLFSISMPDLHEQTMASPDSRTLGRPTPQHWTKLLGGLTLV